MALQLLLGNIGRARTPERGGQVHNGAGPPVASMVLPRLCGSALYLDREKSGPDYGIAVVSIRQDDRAGAYQSSNSSR